MSDTIDFGIDLGTTNSAIAKFTSGKVEVFKDPSTWKDTLPSAVGFRKGRILTGNAARTYQEKDPHNVVSQFKRKMGTSELFRIESLDQSVSPTDLSAHLLRALKTHVQTGEGVGAAVITVPASFDLIQTNATIEAGHLAGISQVLLLQEPIAASLAYANLMGDALDEGTWLVYDLGGGTFDVALVSIQDGQLRVIDHEGDNFLGGANFDLMLFENFAIPRICNEFEEVEMAADFQSASGAHNGKFYSVLKAAGAARISLSQMERCEFEFEFDDELVIVELERADLEELIAPEIKRTIGLISLILERNQKTVNDVDFVLMVGGSTFIPYVRNSVEERLGLPVRSNIDPTTAIAIGAAYYAGVKERDLREQVAPISERSIGIKSIYERATKELEELFAAKVTGDISGLFYQIRREDGGFDTGLRALQERISEDLPLVRDSYNYFSFAVFDTTHKKIETNLSKIQIGQNIYSPQGQPVTNNIYLELDDIETGATYLKEIFRKQTLLPAKSRAIKVKANRNVRAGTTSDDLKINVYQGSVEELPEANQLIAHVILRGMQFQQDLTKGSEIELRFSIDESQVIKVNAYFEQLDWEYEEEFRIEAKCINVEALQENLGYLRRKAYQELESARQGTDLELANRLESVHTAIDRLEDRSLRLREDDVTDQKLEFDALMRELAGELHGAVSDGKPDRLMADYLEWKEKCDRAIQPLNEPKLVGHLEGITQNESRFTNPPSTATLRSKIEELESLYWYVMWRTPSYITERFNYLVQREDETNNETAYQEMIEKGQIALIHEDYDKLREISLRMYDFLPSSEEVNRGKTGLVL
ncbi:hypothetical protein BH10ACI2_BH10ACI2_01620 [soil metagenome]